MSLDVLLLTDEEDFEAALPTLKAVTQTVRRGPLTDGLSHGNNGHRDTADVAVIDGRTDLAAARTACRRLTSDAPATAVVAVVAPADFAAGGVDRHCAAVPLAAAGAGELPA